MKINHSYTTSVYPKALAFLFLFPATVFAAELKNDSIGNNYCEAPQQTEHFQIADPKRSSNQTGQVLRVLLHRKINKCVISNVERELLEEFAYVNDLDLNWVYVENDWELLPELIKGNGDVIVAQDKTLPAKIQNQVKFTHSWSDASFKIVERADNSRIARFEDLAGRQIAAYRSSPVWNNLLELVETQVGIVLQEIPATVPFDEVMRRVEIAQYDLAVADSLLLDKYLPANSNLEANFNLSDKRKMAWAVNNEAEELHKSLNQYLNQQHLTHDVASTYFEGFSSIVEKGVLRVITTTNPSHYYLHNGKLYGFEYELLNQFATQNKMRVDVVLANTQKEMFDLLHEGKGDVIAASLPSSLLKDNDQIQFTASYNYASPVIVGRNKGNQIIDLRDLEGRRVTLAEVSPYWDFMTQLKDQGLDFELVKADAGINMEGVLLMVSLGMYDLTVVGNHQLSASKNKMPDLKAQFVLSEPQAHRWAVRSSDQQLVSYLNDFVEHEFRGAKYNVTHAKYFEQPQIKKLGKDHFTAFSSLSPYDVMTQHYSEEFGFDWRLITALMFQESQFNPEATSYAGAEGLMQLIPATAELMGVSDTNNPEMSINAGIRYLNYLRAKFEDSILLQDRMWFTIASYNAGYGRVKRARTLAIKMGLDKDKWFDNVEVAMMALAKPVMKDGAQVRYCRCGQTVVYVREIRTRYFNYIRLVETQQLALNTVDKDLNRSARLN